MDQDRSLIHQPVRTPPVRLTLSNLPPALQIGVQGMAADMDPGFGSANIANCERRPLLTSCSLEAFVAQLNSDLSAIPAATFLGGTGSDVSEAITLDGLGNVYVVGNADQFSDDFPGVDSGSADSDFGGANEGFIAKLNPDLNNIPAATFLGGSSDELAGAITLDNIGNVYVAVQTGSGDFLDVYDTDEKSAADGVFSGFEEAFVAKLDPNLSAPPVLCGWCEATIGGATAGPDVLIGTPGPDAIQGLGGNDRICGSRGRDRLFGQRGNDRLFGQRGRDVLRGPGQRHLQRRSRPGY
jgi:Ca2+-binding RTX toxin-like protein